jgi:hypothetical protein
VAGWLVARTRRRALIQGKSWIPVRVNVTLEHRSTVCHRRPGTFDELLELGAARVARPVPRGGGGSDTTSLPNQLTIACSRCPPASAPLPLPSADDSGALGETKTFGVRLLHGACPAIVREVS